MDWLQDILLMFGTGGVTSIILRIIDRKSLTRQTLSVLTYSTLSGKVEHLLDQDYATPEQRREIEHSAEGADVTHHAQPRGRSHVFLDAAHHFVSGLEVHTGLFITFRHNNSWF